MLLRNLIIFLFICSALKVQSQERRFIISGKIKSNVESVEGIHILNKNSLFGSISNSYGEFKIPVKLNDTLAFIGIQFYKLKIIITKKQLKNKIVIVHLLQKVNELNEVVIFNHKLTGNIVADAKGVKKIKSKMNILNFTAFDFSKVAKIDHLDRQKPPDPFSNAKARFGGANIFGLVSLALHPLFKEVEKIGKRKRKLKKEHTQYQKTALMAPDRIREGFGDAFFNKELNIPSNQIEAFLIYCKSKDIADLYLSNKKIELIEILIAESKKFRVSLKK